MTSGISTPPSSSSGGDDPMVAAKQLEAYFLRRILSEVGPGSAFGGKGVAGNTFRGMFEEALADAVADTGQVGLADQIAESLHGAGGRRASADLASTAQWADVEGDADPEAIADAAFAERVRDSAAKQAPIGDESE